MTPEYQAVLASRINAKIREAIGKAMVVGMEPTRLYIGKEEDEIFNRIFSESCKFEVSSNEAKFDGRLYMGLRVFVVNEESHFHVSGNQESR